MALLIFHSSCIGYVLSLARMGLFHGTFKLRRFFPAFVNESNGGVNTEEGVRRVIYSSQAYDANAQGVAGGIKLLNAENSSKTGISGDKGGTRLWWDNADKGNF